MLKRHSMYDHQVVIWRTQLVRVWRRRTKCRQVAVSQSRSTSTKSSTSTQSISIYNSTSFVSNMIDRSAFTIFSASIINKQLISKTLDDNQDLCNILLLIYSKCHSITRVSVTLSSILCDLQQSAQLSSQCCRELLNAGRPGFQNTCE